MSSEFNLIHRYFTRPVSNTDLGIGDDAALIQVNAGQQLAISTDASVAGVHFPVETDPYDIGWKSLAVNVSDMAAMGATPKWATLSLTLSNADESWLTNFSAGFFTCADAFGISLIGGDTTQGPLNIAVQIMGEVPMGQALTRSNAQSGDDIWVSGQLGSAALGLAHILQKTSLDQSIQANCIQALNQPQPRVALGIALRGVAHSCIDISDGLLADLGHILQASHKGAVVNVETIPCLAAIKPQLQSPNIQHAILAGGDDYELCFTAAPEQKQHIQTIAQQLGLNLTHIGQINDTNKLTVSLHGQHLNLDQPGYEHFK